MRRFMPMMRGAAQVASSRGALALMRSCIRVAAIVTSAAGLAACEEPYYGDIGVAQFRPDDPRVVGPNAYQLRPAPYGVASPRPVYELRSPMAVVQRQWQDWNTPAPRPASPGTAVAAATVPPTPSSPPAPAALPSVADPAPVPQLPQLDGGAGQPLLVPGEMVPPLPGIPGQPPQPAGTVTREWLAPISAPAF